MPKNFNKYKYYEEAVQNPQTQAITFGLIYCELNGRTARSLREDFCGTFMISCEWIKSDPKHTAIGVDIDAEPLRYGKKHHLSKLSPSQKKRLHIYQKNVLDVHNPKSDIIAACNFSFYVLKNRKSLVEYFKVARNGLNKDGLFILEMAGGPGMIEKIKEKRIVNAPHTGRFTYIWDQNYFDPITHNARYAIHFKLPNGKLIENAFTYDWRMWTLPEVRDAMKDAGFKNVYFYWDIEEKGDDSYVRREHGENNHAWIAFIVGQK